MGCGASSISKIPVKKDFHDQYKLGEKLGSGSFGCVYKARLRNKGDPNYDTTYAAKILDKQAPDGPSAKEVKKDFTFEVDMLSKTKGSKYVIQLMDAFEDSRFCYVVMECCGQTVLEAFTDPENECSSEADLAKVLRQMMAGIAHCHSMGIVHRDVKPTNYLLSFGSHLGDKDCVIKLCDLGFAVAMPDNAKGGLTEHCGTAPFMAPEILKDEKYGFKVDVWAFGVSAYLMLFGSFPYNPPQPCSKAMKKLIKQGAAKPSYRACEGLEQPSSHAIQFVQTLLERQPKIRPSAPQVLDMPYVRDSNVDDITAHEPTTPTQDFFRRRDRLHSLHSNFAKAAQKQQEIQDERAISPKALQIFEVELQKMQEIHGIKRPSLNRTMTLPSTKSGSLSESLSTADLDGRETASPQSDYEYSIASPESHTSWGAEDRQPSMEAFSRCDSVDSRRSSKRHHTHGGEVNPQSPHKSVNTEEGRLMNELRQQRINDPGRKLSQDRPNVELIE